MQTATNKPQTITARKVDSKERLNFLSRNLNNPAIALDFEQYAFRLTEKTTKEYQGGMWDFYEYDNGAWAMLLDDKTIVTAECYDNYYRGEMTLNAVSLATNLKLCSILSFQTTGETQERLASNYHLLREVVFEHPESAEILALID